MSEETSSLQTTNAAIDELDPPTTTSASTDPAVVTTVTQNKGAVSNQVAKLKDANSKYKSLLKLAKERIQSQEEEMNKLKAEILSLSKKNEDLSVALSSSSALEGGSKVEDNILDNNEQSESILIRIWQRVKVESNSSDNGNSDYDIWALLEFESDPDTTLTPSRHKQWKRFGSEQALSDYIRRDNNIMGERIQIPPYSLSADQSAMLEEEAKKNIAQVTEEFRRYRVKAEVARRQADEQLKVLQCGNVENTQKRIEGQDIEKELAQARSEHIELETLKHELTEQETHWKSAYETLLAENNALKSSGAEALLAAQWRQRYESCHREKDDLETKLAMLTDKAKNSDMHKYELKYRELKEAFRSYRRKAKEIFDDVQRDKNDTGMTDFSARVTEDAKMQYLRNLMVNYLSSDPDIREHMEDAIGTVLKFSDEEKARIEKKRIEGDDWFSMIKI